MPLGVHQFLLRNKVLDPDWLLNRVYYLLIHDIHVCLFFLFWFSLAGKCLTNQLFVRLDISWIAAHLFISGLPLILPDLFVVGPDVKILVGSLEVIQVVRLKVTTDCSEGHETNIG